MGLQPDQWSGYFINLDRSADRRQTIEAALSDLGLASLYKRFPAVDGASLPRGGMLKPAVLGCFRSHYHALAQARHDGRFVHILEDDAVPSKEMAPALQAAIISRRLDPYDLIFTDIFFQFDLHLIRLLKSGFDLYLRDGSLQLLDLKEVMFACMSSYLVNPRSLKVIVSLLETEIVRGPTLPVDLFLRKKIGDGTLKAACLFPFLTSVDGSESTIDSGRGAADAASIMLRHAFFVGGDPDEDRRKMQRIANLAGSDHSDTRLDLLAEILRLYISDKFR